MQVVRTKNVKQWGRGGKECGEEWEGKGKDGGRVGVRVRTVKQQPALMFHNIPAAVNCGAA